MAGFMARPAFKVGSINCFLAIFGICFKQIALLNEGA